MTDGAAAPPDGVALARRATLGRLRRRQDFLAAASGRRFHTERMTAQSRLRDGGETRDGVVATGFYVGLTITKRVGHATERNRIRRRLRRAVQIAAATTPGVHADLVLVARRPALDAPFETLIDDVKRALAASARPRRTGSKPDAGARHLTPETLQTKTPRGSTDG